MKFFKWLSRSREKEAMQMYVDAFKKPLPYQDFIIVSQPKPSPTTLYPPIEEKEK